MFWIPQAAAAYIFFSLNYKAESTEFYKAAAGIIPALLLALVIENRGRYGSALGISERLAVVAAVGWLGGTGFVTLRALAYDDAARGSFKIVVSAMVAAITYLTLAMVVGPMRKKCWRLKDPRDSRLARDLPPRQLRLRRHQLDCLPCN